LTVLDLSYQVSREVGDFQHDASLAHKIFEGYLHHAGIMASPTPLKRKRSGEDVITIETKRLTQPIEPATINPDSNLLLYKDEIINHLRLELARSNNELAFTQRKLWHTEYQLSEAVKQIPKPPSTLDIYKTGVEAVERTHQTLLDKVYTAKNSEGITTDTFAQASLRHLDTVRVLEQMEGGLIPAFDLMMLVARTCWCDPDMGKQMSGYGDSEEPFLDLDAQLLGLIEKRHAETERQGAVAAADWAVAPLKRMKSARDYLAQFGVDGYFPDSIDELEGILGVEE
jgi:hypothetical protein